METPISFLCHHCGCVSNKPAREARRSNKLGRLNFCGLSCAAKARKGTRRAPDLSKVCLQCGQNFVTRPGTKETDYCGQSCANRGKVTDYQRTVSQAVGYRLVEKFPGSAAQLAQVLKKREQWRYAGIKDKLPMGHEFEYALGHYIFDLYLPDRVLIEFDGRYHNTPAQRALDKVKEQFANDAGYRVLRVEMPAGMIIPFSALNGIL